MSPSFGTRARAVFGIDPRTLALFRVALGTLLIADLVLRARDLSAFYTDAGTLTRAHWGALAHRWHWSLHAASGELWYQALLFCLAGLAAFALIVGLRTRAASVVSFVLLASLINRNTLVLQGGDILLVVMAFWAMFLPLGMRWSLDAALDPRLREDPNAVRAASLPYRPYLSVATVAIVLQTLYLYFFTALLKTGDPWVKTFEAARGALGLRHFATPLGDWLRDFPAFLRVATGYVLSVEFVGPLLVLCALAWPLGRHFERVFAATRIGGLLLLGSLHAGFLLLLHIGLFPLIDFMSLSVLVPGIVWAWLAGRGSTSASVPDVSSARPDRAVTLHYDVDCGFCLKMCTILREFLLAGDTRILPAQAHPEIFRIMERENSWVVTDASGTPHVHWHAMALLFRQRAVFRPLGWLMSRAAADRARQPALPGRGHEPRRDGPLDVRAAAVARPARAPDLDRGAPRRFLPRRRDRLQRLRAARREGAPARLDRAIRPARPDRPALGHVRPVPADLLALPAGAGHAALRGAGGRVRADLVRGGLGGAGQDVRAVPELSLAQVPRPGARAPEQRGAPRLRGVPVPQLEHRRPAARGRARRGGGVVRAHRHRVRRRRAAGTGSGGGCGATGASRSSNRSRCERTGRGTGAPRVNPGCRSRSPSRPGSRPRSPAASPSPRCAARAAPSRPSRRSARRSPGAGSPRAGPPCRGGGTGP